MSTQRRGLSKAAAGLFAATALALAFLLAAAPSWAAVTCATTESTSTADADGDGYTDFEECGGITIYGTQVTVPACPGENTTYPALGCLDPDKKDLFVILVRAASSNIPADGLSSINVLGAVLHEVPVEVSGLMPYTNITYNQKASKIVESLDTNGTDFGEMPWGTPNSTSSGSIYTQRIIDFVNGKEGADKPTVYIPYIREVLAHEVGHGLRLTSAFSSKLGYHEANTTPGTIMQQAVVYTGRRAPYTWYIPTAWSGASISGYRLK